MNEIDAITPVKDVWLRPRRVFRELASRPIGSGDVLLASLQGIADYVALIRLHVVDSRATTPELLAGALLVGPLAGLIGTAVWAFLYSRLGSRVGGKAGFVPVLHVLTYGAVPRAAVLILWASIALVVGDPAFVAVPPAGTDAFVAVLLRAERIAEFLAFVWAYLLQVMGLSEVFDFKLSKAFGLWVSGQLLVGILWLLVLNLGQMR